MANPKIKAVFFDFMGTCLDWHTGATQSLPSAIPDSEKSQLALDWRHTYFDINAARVKANQPPENIDITLRAALEKTIQTSYSQHTRLFDDTAIQRCVASFHSMPAWPDVPPALEQLKAKGYEIFVFANGTTRLQLDLCRSSGLDFDMLFSSEILGVIKPDPRCYWRVLELVGVKAEESVMVAAHAYDTRGAIGVGMRTVYVRRWTDDVNEDMDVVREEHDFFLEDMVGLDEVIGQF